MRSRAKSLAALIIVGLIILPDLALAATRTWDGGGSTNNWSEAANWSDNTAPTAADTALFDGTDATDATVDADILVSAITVTSGYGGTLNFGSATITGSVGDGAVQFTAADKSWLQITDASQTGLDPGTSDFSVSGWIRMDTLPAASSYWTMLGKGTGNTRYDVIIDSNGKLGLRFGVSSTVIFTGGTTLSAGTWYFIVVNFDRDGNAGVYINNIAESSPADISGQSASFDSADVFAVGYATAVGTYFNGKIDSLSFSSRLLTADEITWLYNAGSGRVYKDIGIAGNNGSALKTNLVSWWDLGENAGTRYDSYGTNNLSQSFGNIIAPPVYSTEKLTNGDFETVTSAGPPANFGTWNEGTGDGNIEVETTVIHGESNAAKLTMGASFNTNINQNYSSITAGATYRLSFWSAGDGTNAGLVRVYDISNAVLIRDYTTTGITAGTYGLVTYDFVAPTGCTNVGFYFRPASVNGGIAYLDDVSLKQITTASINNGGFEDWTTSTNAGTWVESVSGTSTVNREDTTTYNGTNAARLDHDASNNIAGMYGSNSQPIGKLYSYTVYARGGTGTPSLYVGSYGYGYNSHTLTTSYAAYSSTYRSDPSTSRTFGFLRNSAASNSIYIDSVTLTAAEILGTSGIPRGQSPAVDYAGQFNGTSQSLSATTTAFNPGTGDFSLGASFYLDSYPGSTSAATIFSSGTNGSGSDYYVLRVLPSGANYVISVTFNDSSGAVWSGSTTATITTGNWYTVVANFNRAGNCTVSLNNATAENLGAISGKSGNVDAGNLYVGRYAASAVQYFPGRINGAFYANRVLTTDEITYLHNNGKWRMFSEFGLPSTNGSALTSSVVRGWWGMDTAGNLGLDSTTNGNNLTNNGTVTQGTGNSQYTGGATFMFDQPGTLNLSSATIDLLDGTFEVAGAGAITPGTSTLQLRGISNLSGSTTQSLHNVKVLTGAVVTQRSATTLDGTLTISGSYIVSAGNLSVGRLFLPGRLTLNGNTLSASGSVDLTSGTFTHGNGTLRLTGGNSHTLKTDSESLYNLTVSGSGIYDLSDTLTVTHALNISGSTLDLNGQTIVVTGASFGNEGTLRLQGGETLTGFTNDSDSGIVYFDGTSGPYTLKDWPYYGLTVNGAGTTFNLPATLDVNGNLTITAGTVDVTSNNYGITIGGSWGNSGAFNARSGTVTFDGTGNQTLSAGSSHFEDITVNKAAGTLQLASAVDLEDLNILAGTLKTTGYTLTLTGSLTNKATLTPGTGSVVLTGANQTLSGSTSFYNLTKTVSASDTLYFYPGYTYTVNGTVDLSGGSKIFSLKSSIDGVHWNFAPPAASLTLVGLVLKDSYNTRLRDQVCLDCTDSGNNQNWDFENSPTINTVSAGTTSVSGSGGGGGGRRGSPAQMQSLIKQAQLTILARFETSRQKIISGKTPEQLVAEKKREEDAKAEQAEMQREQKIRERITQREAEVALAKKNEQEMKQRYELYRDERIARALAAEQQKRIESETQLRKEQEALVLEQQQNAARRTERLAKIDEMKKSSSASSVSSSLSASSVASEPGRRVPAAEGESASSSSLVSSVSSSSLSSSSSMTSASSASSSSAFSASAIAYSSAAEINSSASEIAASEQVELAAQRRNRYMSLVDEKPVIYKDVPLDAWFAPYVAYVIEEKIAQGYRSTDGTPKGEFGVANPVTYAEVLKMALEATDVKIDGLPPPRNISAKGTWASAYVAKAETLALAVFNPDLDVNQSATRGAVIQTILEVMGIPTDIKIPSPFTDVPSTNIYAKAITTAAAYGLVQGDNDASGNPLNRFRPDDPINRAEVAKIIALAKELLK